jgi:hypothetical protein
MRRQAFQGQSGYTGGMAIATKGEDYTCALCGKTHTAQRTEDECLYEMETFFGKVPEEEIAVICDDCWQKIHPNRN